MFKFQACLTCVAANQLLQDTLEFANVLLCADIQNTAGQRLRVGYKVQIAIRWTTSRLIHIRLA
jgi:hypothetical protein